VQAARGGKRGGKPPGLGRVEYYARGVSNGAWIVVAGAVGGILAILGGFVERAARGRGELVAAAAAWLGAVESLALIAQMDATFSIPPSNRLGRWLDWAADQLEDTMGKGRAELLRTLVHRPLIRRVEAVSDRVWETTYALILSAPSPLIREIQPHLDALGEWMNAPTDASLKERWESESRPAVTGALRKWTQPLWRRLLHR
jgi:hypothetical protein